MDKQTFISKIQASKVSDSLKKELVDMVNAQSEFGPQLIQEVQARLDDEAYLIIDEVTNMTVKAGMKDVNAKFDEIDDDIKKFNSDISQEADKIDLEQTRQKIQE